jgi:hypothetical protein
MRLLPLTWLLFAAAGSAPASILGFAEFGAAPAIDGNGLHTQDVGFGFTPGQQFAGDTAPQPGGVYSEGDFLYSGEPITGAGIAFFNGFDLRGKSVGAFGLDNLTFETPDRRPSLELGRGC